MPDQIIPKKMLYEKPDEKISRGRPLIRWLEDVEDDLRRLGFRRWKDRGDWLAVVEEREGLQNHAGEDDFIRDLEGKSNNRTGGTFNLARARRGRGGNWAGQWRIRNYTPAWIPSRANICRRSWIPPPIALHIAPLQSDSFQSSSSILSPLEAGSQYEGTMSNKRPVPRDLHFSLTDSNSLFCHLMNWNSTKEGIEIKRSPFKFRLRQEMGGIPAITRGIRGSLGGWEERGGRDRERGVES
ncbi:unnamed protein product [Nezara viridula]|uniref:Uncharacterized protein n=1 Tax=Nezara viridula TaxID=85310 RepID=A0A9P0GXW8_NEZVI|nr:unnamed protein product [Nezara viridula]